MHRCSIDCCFNGVAPNATQPKPILRLNWNTKSLDKKTIHIKQKAYVSPYYLWTRVIYGIALSARIIAGEGSVPRAETLFFRSREQTNDLRVLVSPLPAPLVLPLVCFCTNIRTLRPGPLKYVHFALLIKAVLGIGHVPPFVWELRIGRLKFLYRIHYDYRNLNKSKMNFIDDLIFNSKILYTKYSIWLKLSYKELIKASL